MKLNIFCLLAVLLLLGAIQFGNPNPGRAQAGDPYALIDAVNGLRAASGLPPYEVNNILMGTAQGQSDYQAAIGSVTHTGPGGTRPKDRAAAAGYGGGATFFMSENIAGGTDLSVDGAIGMWLGDDPHIQTMLGANYRDIGAGVAVSNGFVYYTIDVAYVAGSGNYVPAATYTPGGPTAIPYYAVQTVTPMPDGSIVHTVKQGQNLSLIAKAYGLLVAEIKGLNNLTSDNLYVGDKLIIKVANTPGPTSTLTPTITPTRQPTATRNPTRTPTPSATLVISPVATTQVDPVSKTSLQIGQDQAGNILVMAIIGLAAGGVVLMLIGSLIRRGNRDQGD